MRLIDLDAFREEYDLRDRCEDCGRLNKKACDYPSYSARDFCGWLDDVPTIEAVPLDKLCEWLAVNASYMFGGYTKNTWKFEASHWEHEIREWMKGEGLDAPTVDAVLVTHGKWHKPMNYYVECNLCGNTYEIDFPQPTAKWNYCPGCGAKMDLEETK